MKKQSCFIFIFLILVVMGCASEKKVEEEIMNAVVIGQYEEAKHIVFKHFENNKNKAVQWLMVIRESEGAAYKDKLVIQRGLEWDNNRGYNYVRGRVKNTGDKTISYFKIKVLYKDENENVVDTDYTNSGDTLMPNMAKEFEIMHRDSSDYKHVAIYVDEVHIQ